MLLLHNVRSFKLQHLEIIFLSLLKIVAQEGKLNFTAEELKFSELFKTYFYFECKINL